MPVYSTQYPILTELNIVSVALRLVLAAIFGGVIGIDRGRKRRPAGLRTHMLVCLGSALVMITNQYISELYNMSDPARLGAQVISGIGFLGAGTIIVTRHQQVKGLTTAAGLWCSACMGLAVGIGFYEGALIACVLIVFIVIVMNRLDNRVASRSRVMELYVEMELQTPLSTLLTYLANHSIRVVYVEFVKSLDDESRQAHTAALVTVRLPKKFHHSEVLDRLGQLDGVAYIDEV